ncbi:hypothetical protein BU26DRAFT_31609 [Trematosphaeria pertusa]|uniref:Uncharacterized protein n=1 Tax=Trematosphaeria pertusa TaxID=390896 RepID=A0A6A6J2F5_9PLEO|nr:uncharacterized protein BU26DRAFT_31609 [Trematosphaeria pertusa]KAF2256899.1 hypothetical protein BU26DRAFT_31609 [Trematosphaeria pertusa]
MSVKLQRIRFRAMKPCLRDFAIPSQRGGHNRALLTAAMPRTQDHTRSTDDPVATIHHSPPALQPPSGNFCSRSPADQGPASNMAFCRFSCLCPSPATRQHRNLSNRTMAFLQSWSCYACWLVRLRRCRVGTCRFEQARAPPHVATALRLAAASADEILDLGAVRLESAGLL